MNVEFKGNERILNDARGKRESVLYHSISTTP